MLGVRLCISRLARARNEEEESSAEPWFHCGPRDVFPEQWLPFLSIPAALSEVFIRQHGCLLTASWWRAASVTRARGRRSVDRSVVECRVDQIAEQSAKIIALTWRLNHHDREQLLGRIDPECRAARPPQKYWPTDPGT